MMGELDRLDAAARLHRSASAGIAEAMGGLGLGGPTWATAAPGVGGTEPRTLSLVDLGDGALAWRDGDAPPLVGDLPREGVVPMASIVRRVPVEALRPNEVGAALIRWDAKLTPGQGLREWVDGRLVPRPAVPVDVDGTLGDDAGRPRRILLVVHGTFSSGDAIFDQWRTAEPDAQFLAWAARHYACILAFDHPTLSVSPVLNGLDLARHFAGVRAPVDVICHSRGGLVVRWWLEAFGGMNAGPRRVVFVASPLGGTSLASPPRLRGAIDLFTTVGSHLKGAGEAASVYLPFLNVALALLNVFAAVTGAVAATPLADAAFALVPGLGGMSRVGNNGELDRLNADRPGIPPYFAITSNFRMADVGWKFWKYFDDPALRVVEAGCGQVFGQENDLVVDTRSMTELARGLGLRTERIGTFEGVPNPVFHTNYFLQPRTAEYFTRFLGASA